VSLRIVENTIKHSSDASDFYRQKETDKNATLFIVNLSHFPKLDVASANVWQDNGDSWR
jgi:hypothetical protein